MSLETISETIDGQICDIREMRGWIREMIEHIDKIGKELKELREFKKKAEKVTSLQEFYDLLKEIDEK